MFGEKKVVQKIAISIFIKKIAIYPQKSCSPNAYVVLQLDIEIIKISLICFIGPQQKQLYMSALVLIRATCKHITHLASPQFTGSEFKSIAKTMRRFILLGDAGDGRLRA